MGSGQCANCGCWPGYCEKCHEPPALTAENIRAAFLANPQLVIDVMDVEEMPPILTAWETTTYEWDPDRHCPYWYEPRAQHVRSTRGGKWVAQIRERNGWERNWAEESRVYRPDLDGTFGAEFHPVRTRDWGWPDGDSKGFVTDNLNEAKQRIDEMLRKHGFLLA